MRAKGSESPEVCWSRAYCFDRLGLGDIIVPGGVLSPRGQLERNNCNMNTSDLEQQTDSAEAHVKPRSRKLLITLIVTVFVVAALAVAWYLLTKDMSNQVDGWWNDIRGGTGGSGGSGGADPGNL